MFKTIKNALKTPEIRKRILYTLLLIVIFRFGCYITVPGVDSVALENIKSSATNSISGLIDIISGGAFSKLSVFAMTITPYITASIVIQLLGMVIPSLEKLIKEGGEEGKEKINKYTIGKVNDESDSKSERKIDFDRESKSKCEYGKTLTIVKDEIVEYKLMNNKIYVIVKYKNGMGAVFNIATMKKVPGSNAHTYDKLVNILKEIDRDTLSSWCNVDIKLGTLSIELRENRCFVNDINKYNKNLLEEIIKRNFMITLDIPTLKHCCQLFPFLIQQLKGKKSLFQLSLMQLNIVMDADFIKDVGWRKIFVKKRHLN